MPHRVPCERVEVWAAEHLEGLLPPNFDRLFRDHVGSCVECGAELGRTLWTIDQIRSIPHEQMPAGMKKRLLESARCTTSAYPLRSR